MQYRPEIDGLRAVAIVPVVLFHAGFSAFAGGYVGVDVFFVISGYLITSIILDEQDAGRFTLVGFYDRRMRRILPALFVVMFACLPFAALWMLPNQLREFSQSVTAVPLFVSNVVFWLQGGYFGDASELKPLLHTWSLAVEEQYYIIFPAMLILIGRTRRRLAVGLIASIAVTSLLLAEWGIRHAMTATFFLTPMRAWEILLGSLCAFAVHGRTHLPHTRYNGALSLLGLGLIVFAVFAFNQDTPFPSRYALVPTFGTALVVLFCTPGTWLHQGLSASLPVGIGLISYSTYLWHQPLFAFARIKGYGEGHSTLFAALIASSLALGFVSWRYVERPFRGRKRFRLRHVLMVSGALSTSLVALGMTGALTDGLIYRYDPADQALLRQFDPLTRRIYTPAAFDAARDAPFDPAAKKLKVTVIGDSYAQDMVNVIVESGAAQGIQLSTRYIPAVCQMTYPVDESFPFAGKYLDYCRSADNLAKARPQLRASDVVIFAAQWRLETAESFRHTLQALGLPGTTAVVVIGMKLLPPIDLRDVLGRSVAEKRAIRAPLDASTKAVNDALRATLPRSVRFVDPMALLCGSSDVCPLFDNEGRALSPDAGHLTPAGAAYLGKRLFPDGALTDLLSDPMRAAHSAAAQRRPALD